MLSLLDISTTTFYILRVGANLECYTIRITFTSFDHPLTIWLYQSHMSLTIWLPFNIAGLCSLDLIVWLCQSNLSELEWKTKFWVAQTGLTLVACIYIVGSSRHYFIFHSHEWFSMARRQPMNFRPQPTAVEGASIFTYFCPTPTLLGAAVRGSVGAHYWSENNHRDMFWDTIPIANNKTYLSSNI
jgi:hypothetical protein